MASPGPEVTVLEGLPTFLGAVDEQIAKEANKLFTKQGLSINLGCKINKVTKGDNNVTVEYDNAKGEANTAVFDKLIVSIGRTPNTNGLAAKVGLALDERASWRSTTTARPTCQACGRSATWCARCWRTKRKKKALPWPSVSPASTVTPTSHHPLGDLHLAGNRG
jgi:pyruvate/2-oxoglutarate dehydrogenase complex dihydrolipoamide dehydrogenase (E3) component